MHPIGLGTNEHRSKSTTLLPYDLGKKQKIIEAPFCKNVEVRQKCADFSIIRATAERPISIGDAGSKSIGGGGSVDSGGK